MSHQPIYLKDYQPPTHWIQTTDLQIILAPRQATVTATLVLKRNNSVKQTGFLTLQGEAQTLISVMVDGQLLKPADYTLTAESLMIPTEGDTLTLQIVSTHCPEDNKTLSGLYYSRGNYCTQCEAEGFRRITYFLDRPDVLSVFTTTIMADKVRYPHLLSNGNRIAQGENTDGTHWVKWHDPFPKPAYLFAMVAGNLALLTDTFTTRSGRQVAIEFYVEPPYRHQVDHAIASLKKSMAFDESVYGLEYDLDLYMVVAVEDFNMGAMENKGLNIFNTKYVLADAETATDLDYQNIESVIGHEYFHNWSGNRVTLRDWFQLSLKEGFTVYREQQFAAQCGLKAPLRIDEVNLIRTRQFAEDSSPMAHPIRPASYQEINNFYTVTIYQKGAEVIRMLHTLLGDEAYYQGVNLYFKRHDGQAATTDDFVAALASASGQDLTQFCRWYEQAGTPMVQLSGRYDAIKKQFVLEAGQSCPPTPEQIVKAPFVIPIRLQLLDDTGHALLPENTVVTLTEAKQQFRFDNIKSQPTPSLFRDFSAPVKWYYPYQEKEQILLLQHDTCPINRWDIGQSIFTSAIFTGMQTSTAAKLSPQVLAILDTLLQDTNQDPALLARLLMLPGFGYLVDQQNNTDPEKLLSAMLSLEKQLATKLSPSLLACYQRYLPKNGYKYDPVRAAHHAITNACLYYLVRAEPQHGMQLVEAQYEKADNMTLRMGALRAINDSYHALRHNLLVDFYARYQSYPLVIDKWFALHGSARYARSFESIRALTQHPAFEWTNPNKVYSLIGAFGQNPAVFHQKNGEGYAFLAEVVCQLDKQNPQVASRMIDPLMQAKQYADPYHSQMRGVLEQLNREKLSANVAEKVTKALYPPP